MAIYSNRKFYNDNRCTLDRLGGFDNDDDGVQLLVISRIGKAQTTQSQVLQFYEADKTVDKSSFEVVERLRERMSL